MGQTWSVLSVLKSQDLDTQQAFGENMDGRKTGMKASYPDSHLSSTGQGLC